MDTFYAVLDWNITSDERKPVIKRNVLTLSSVFRPIGIKILFKGPRALKVVWDNMLNGKFIAK